MTIVSHRSAMALLLIAALTGCADTDADRDFDGEVEVERTSTDTMAVVAPTGTEELVDPNGAVEEQLLAVPGLDSAALSTIIRGRPFENVLALNDALSAHLDSAALDAVYRRIWIPIDLNQATREEILLIPGVGERMAHEFEEYRPYRGMEEFRREIGKYVDEEEVARLERYVTLR